MKTKYLVTGATGLLGSTLVKLLNAKHECFIECKREDIGLSKNATEISNILEASGCNVLIHCAANTNVEQCEVEQEECFKANYLWPEVLASICNRLGIKFVFISSTGIYGSYKNDAYTELDDVSPTTAHHTAKYKAESSVALYCPNSLIIRTGWLFGGDAHTKKNFIANRIKEAKNSDGVIYSDTRQKGNPSYVVDVAERILLLIQEQRCGVYNCVSEGTASRFEYVREIIALSSESTRVEKFEGEFKRVAKVSPNESALNYKMNLLGYPKMRHWRDALSEYITKSKL